jgi:N-acyl amino acid synthase of PEP-CTERM/exosortase system
VADQIDKSAPKASVETEHSRLVDLYRLWFDVVPARTPEQVRESQRLRYQVYCVETGFENAEEFPEGLERDQFDEDGRTVCSLLVHKPTQSVAGTVRLILPDNRPDAPELPTFSVSKDLASLPDQAVPRARTGEISRFAISKQFRKRAEDTLIPALYEPTGKIGDIRVIPHITLGLMQAILQMSLENNITHLVIAVEPALDRLIRRLGIVFTPVGPLFDYHGKRRAHYRQIGELLDEVYEQRPEIWEVLTNAGKMWPAPSRSVA